MAGFPENEPSLRRARIVPPVPNGKMQAAPINEVRGSSHDDDAASTCCFIEYVDADGEPSSRVITFKSIEGDFGQIERINAFCHLRNDRRQFTIANIGAMICAYTGEELDPLEHCLSIRRQGALKVDDRTLTQTMRVVTFLARCDNQMHELEAKAIEDVIGRYFRFFGGDDAAYECACRETVRVAPTSRQALSAVNYLRRLPNREEMARFVTRATSEIVDADGIHRPEEVYWGIEVGKLLKAVAAPPKRWLAAL